MTKNARRNKKAMFECFDNFYQELDTHTKGMTQIMLVFRGHLMYKRLFKLKLIERSRDRLISYTMLIFNLFNMNVKKITLKKSLANWQKAWKQIILSLFIIVIDQ